MKEQDLLNEIDRLKSEIKKLKNRKKYGLVWEDKPEQVVLDCQNKLPIIKEEKKKEIKTDKNRPGNILIEGDNYHSLSILNYTHRGKVDVIYIDPPYNTGNKDFMYNDSYIDKEDSFRHSKWLSFMSKRLELAKNILKTNGIIFISIDYYEYAQIKLLCDNIFLEKNFVNSIVWKKTNSIKSQATSLGNQHEMILVYSKNLERLRINKKIGLLNDNYIKSFRHNDNNGKGLYQTIALSNKTSMGGFSKMKEWEWRGVKARWIYSKNKLDDWYNKNLIYKTKNGYRLKDYLNNKKGVEISDIWINDEIKALQGGSNEYIGFATQKPLSLIKRVIKMCINNNAVILDFFAGSGTTGHAVLELNKEDGGNRKFILCTNNENKIAEDICYPRVNKVIKGYKNKKGEKVEGLGGNLKYYKTDFLDSEHINKISDDSKIKLTYQAGEMIALRENTLDEVEKNEWWQIFTDGEKQTAIYFKEDKSKLQKLVDKLSKNKSVLYIFSWGKNEYKNEFLEHKNIRIEDIPEPIIELYKEINKL